MKKLLLLTLVSCTLFAFDPGTVIQFGLTVTAEAGNIRCIYAGGYKPSVNMFCYVLTPSPIFEANYGSAPEVNSNPLVNVINYYFTKDGNSIQLTVKRPDASTLNWTMTANGTTLTGTF